MLATIKPRKIYTEDFKKYVVTLYDAGAKTQQELANEFDVSLPAVSTWVRNYSKKPRNKVSRSPYSTAFKNKIVSEYQKSGEIIADFAYEHGIAPGTLSRWLREFGQRELPPTAEIVDGVLKLPKDFQKYDWEIKKNNPSEAFEYPIAVKKNIVKAVLSNKTDWETATKDYHISRNTLYGWIHKYGDDIQREIQNGDFRVIHRFPHPPEFVQKVVEECSNSDGSRKAKIAIAKKYFINLATMEDWLKGNYVDKSKERPKTPLMERYDEDFKLKVVSDFLSSGKSSCEIAKKYKISQSSVVVWKKKYQDRISQELAEKQEYSPAIVEAEAVLQEPQNLIEAEVLTMTDEKTKEEYQQENQMLWKMISVLLPYATGQKQPT